MDGADPSNLSQCIAPARHLPARLGFELTTIMCKQSKNFLGWERNTKIANKSNQDINLIIYHQPMQVSESVPYPPLETTAERESKIQKGDHPPQQAMLLANSREVFELPCKDYYLTIFTVRPDGSRVFHVRNRLVRKSQNCDFLQAERNKKKKK
jgi:hypothetical protein